jgi:hypothetical protein
MPTPSSVEPVNVFGCTAKEVKNARLLTLKWEFVYYPDRPSVITRVLNSGKGRPESWLGGGGGATNQGVWPAVWPGSLGASKQLPPPPPPPCACK